MDSAVIAAIITVLGAGFLAMFGFFMRGLRADVAALRSEMAELRTEMRAEIAELRTEMRAEFAAVRADIAQLQQAVARIEGVIAEHSRQLDQMADHGARIAALETAAQLARA